MAELNLLISIGNNAEEEVPCSETATILQLKSTIKSKISSMSTVSEKDMVLVFKGKNLTDDKATLKDCNLKNLSIISLLQGVHGGFN